jgi:hypothetical protein
MLRRQKIKKQTRNYSYQEARIKMFFVEYGKHTIPFPFGVVVMKTMKTNLILNFKI